MTLVKSSTIEQEHEALRLAATLVAASLSPSETTFAERLVAPFPWLGFLPKPQRDRFATEIVEVAGACASISKFDRLFVVLAEWRSTAEALAAGYTLDEQLDWLDETETINDPRVDG
ncbi:hypothetical protein GCM10027404_12450 [Arthrobacter tumbae]